MTEEEPRPAPESAPAPEQPAEAQPLPSTVDLDLISHIERGAPSDG